MVLVRGPQDIVDQMRTIPTQPFPLPPAPETTVSNESQLRAEIALVKEIDGRAIQCSPATVAFKCRLHPRQRTYELTDVPIAFLCPANFPWKPTFPTPAAGKVTLRVTGPAADENPQVQAYIDLTQGTFEAGRNREPLRLQLPKDYQQAGDEPRLVTFTLERSKACHPCFRPLPACPAGEEGRRLTSHPATVFDPCRLVRQVKKFGG